MASLVADYGDSSGDSDGEDAASACTRQESAEATKENGVNFFAATENNSSDDAEADAESKSGKAEEAKQEAESAPKLPKPVLRSKLPSPHLGSKKKKKKKPSLKSFVPGPTSSVFLNPFQQAEQAKLGILEKHVRLTEAAPKKPATKQVCFKFKKGKCFLGDKCRFFHDRSNIALGANSDKSVEATTPEAAEQDAGSGFGFGRGDRGFKFPGFVGAPGGEGDGQFYHPVAQFSHGQPADPRAVDDEDSYMASAKARKRHGVTDTLQPSKKAMNDLGSLRKQERPWTMHKKS